MVQINKLDPALDVSLLSLPDESAIGSAAKERACTLITFFFCFAVSFDADVCLPQPELPAFERELVATGCVVFDVELQPRPIEAYGLP